MATAKASGEILGQRIIRNERGCDIPCTKISLTGFQIQTAALLMRHEIQQRPAVSRHDNGLAIPRPRGQARSGGSSHRGSKRSL